MLYAICSLCYVQSVVCFFMCSLFLLPFIAKAELSIQITQGSDNPIPIAVVPFSWQGNGVLSEDISQIVMNDLEQVGEFSPLSRSNMISIPREEQEVFYSDWRILAQDYLLLILPLVTGWGGESMIETDLS